MERRVIVLDASGRRGADGEDGGRGGDGGRGRDGGRGGDAGAATPGEPGGRCQLWLRSGASDAGLTAHQVRVEGEEVRADGGRRVVREEVSPGTLGEIQVRARGGDGGRGGRGGDGGDGGRGRDGSDATRYSAGGNGGPGGDGGDGGRGSAGAPGGDGGDCVVQVDARDAWILMALEAGRRPEALAQGGAGGRAGEHGQGGAGGSGGSGGSSHSWSETRTRQVTRIDAQGRASQETEQYEERFSNSGGWSGSSGSRGWTPTDPIYDGREGSPGRFVIQVGEARYAGRYELELVDFSLVEDDPGDRDGILEFGEVVRATALRVRNVGRMPSPAHQRARVFLREGEWIKPVGDELFVARSLAPGEECVLEGALRLRIAEADVREASDPFVVVEAVSPEARQLGPEVAGRPAQAAAFQRRYEAFALTRALTAQYPVENREGIVALRSLAAGERTWISFDVANVSEVTLGAQAPRPRQVGVQIEFVGGDVGLGDIAFEDGEGQVIDLGATRGGWAGLFVPLAQIEPHQSLHVRGRFGFQAHVPPYVGATLRYTLWLEDRVEAGRWRVAQRRAITLRAEPAYVYRPSSKITLVTHNNTSQAAFLAWKRLLEEELGLPFDHWSIARYGHFDQQAELADGTLLRDHLEDRVALVLNQPFQPRHSDQSDLPSDYIKGEDFRRGATANNAHFLLLGSDRFALREWLEPTSSLRSGGDDFPDVARFLQKEARTGGPLTSEVLKEDITTWYDEVALHAWSLPLMKPDAGKEAQAAALGLQEALVRMHPNRRYVLIKDVLEAPERAGRQWLLFPRWRVGGVEVRRTLNTESSAAVTLVAEAAQVDDPAFVFSHEARYAVLLALPFEEKLDRLNWLLRQGSGEGRMQTGRALVEALLTDLAEEQSALMEGGGRLDDGRLKEKLSNLGRLVEMPLSTQLRVDARQWELLIELCAGLQVMAEAAAPWWKLWGRERALEGWLGRALGQLKGGLFDRYAVDPDGEVAMDSRAAGARIEARAKERAGEIAGRRRALKASLGVEVSEAFAARDLFEHPASVGRRMMRDIDAWLDPKARVWGRAEFAAAVAAEEARARKQAELKAINQRVRAALLARGEGAGDEGAPPAQASEAARAVEEAAEVRAS